MPTRTISTPLVADNTPQHQKLSFAIDDQLPPPAPVTTIAQRLRVTVVAVDANGNQIDSSNPGLSMLATAVLAAMGGTLPGGITGAQFLAALQGIHATVLANAGYA